MNKFHIIISALIATWWFRWCPIWFSKLARALVACDSSDRRVDPLRKSSSEWFLVSAINDNATLESPVARRSDAAHHHDPVNVIIIHVDKESFRRFYATWKKSERIPRLSPRDALVSDHRLAYAESISRRSDRRDRSLRESPGLVDLYRCNLLTWDDMSNIIFLFIIPVAISIFVPRCFCPAESEMISIEYLCDQRCFT